MVLHDAIKERLLAECFNKEPLISEDALFHKMYFAVMYLYFFPIIKREINGS